MSWGPKTKKEIMQACLILQPIRVLQLVAAAPAEPKNPPTPQDVKTTKTLPSTGWCLYTMQLIMCQTQHQASLVKTPTLLALWPSCTKMLNSLPPTWKGVVCDSVYTLGVRSDSRCR